MLCSTCKPEASEAGRLVGMPNDYSVSKPLYVCTACGRHCYAFGFPAGVTPELHHVIRSTQKVKGCITDGRAMAGKLIEETLEFIEAVSLFYASGCRLRSSEFVHMMSEFLDVVYTVVTLIQAGNTTLDSQPGSLGGVLQHMQKAGKVWHRGQVNRMREIIPPTEFISSLHKFYTNVCVRGQQIIGRK